jgi:hypothetical protein
VWVQDEKDTAKGSAKNLPSHATQDKVEPPKLPESVEPAYYKYASFNDAYLNSTVAFLS